MTEPRHSFAEKREPSDDRLFAPAAARNIGPIIDALVPHLPEKGMVLEVASGTGEHVIALAEATPHLSWQPTDVDPERLKSIAAWITHAGTSNIEAPIAFDAVKTPWPGEPANAVFLANLLHLISDADAQALLANLANALQSEGILALYGPFKRGEDYASEGDQRFDAAIRAERPSAGYKSIDWVENQCMENKLSRIAQVAMPANNLMTLWRR
ncbi:MAG: DUF938 domain-containing protein [Cohaesibacteraceae bacterium]